MTIRYPDSDDPAEWDDDLRPRPTALEDAVADFRRRRLERDAVRRMQAWATAEADRNFG